MDREGDYLYIAKEYGGWLRGLRWAAAGDAVEHVAGGTFALAPEIALFLEGFVAVRPPIHFDHVLHLLHLLGLGKTELPEEAAVLARFFVAAGRPMRNAGALGAQLCRRTIPAVADPLDVPQVLGLLWDQPMMADLCTRWAAFPPEQLEQPPLTPAEFEKRILGELREIPLEKLQHWLQHGCGTTGDAGQRIAQQVPPPPAGPRHSLAEVLETLLQRPRLAGAVPFVPQLVSALSLPPRPQARQELPIGGYSDVTNRGHPEHLLLSQFAVDDLEFVRRFAENELLFFRREEPHVQRREELVVLLDQGVRVWGTVRLVLSAAVVALAKFAGRRKMPFLLAGTSSRGKWLDPLEVEKETFAALAEASDLSLNPGLALERLLEEQTKFPRDVVLLSQPRNLKEEDVSAAARLAQRGTRLFALTVDEEGQAQLVEIRYGLPATLHRFRVDLTQKPKPEEKPAVPASPFAPWTGDVEPIGFPFRFGTHGKTRHMDFDDADEWLLTASSQNLLQLHAFKTDGSYCEILPRPMLDGKLITDIQAILGVTGGFAVAGRFGQLLVVAHYDFVTRSCKVHVLDKHADRAPQCWNWYYFREHHSVVADSRSSTRAVDLGTGAHFPMHSPTTTVWPARVQAAAAETEKYALPPPQLVVANVPTMECRKPCLKLSASTGTLYLEGVEPPWQPFTLMADGKSIFQNGVIESAWYRGNVLAVIARIYSPSYQRYDRVFRLFRGPDGTPLAEYNVPEKFTLSHNSQLLARTFNNPIEVRELESGKPRFLIPKGGTHNQGLNVFLGERGIIVRVGRWRHAILWTHEGPLALRCYEGDAKQLAQDVLAPPTWHEVKREELRGLAAIHHDSHRFVSAARSSRLTVAADAFGQIAVFDQAEKLVCMFFVFRKDIAAWMPDGTRYGPASITGGPATVGALDQLGQALRRASQ